VIEATDDPEPDPTSSMTNLPNPVGVDAPDQLSVSEYGELDWEVELVDNPPPEPWPETVWQAKFPSVSWPLPRVMLPQVSPCPWLTAAPIMTLPIPIERVRVSDPLDAALVNADDAPNPVNAV